MKAPSVSILTPCLNQARFLQASLDSVLAQSHTDWELLVADGGSQDGSVEILRATASRDPRLRFFSEPDNGPADAVNKAFHRSRGQICGWLNADDLFAADAIAAAIREFKNIKNLLLVYGHGEWIDEKGRSKGLYPTLPPSVGVEEFQKGCFICQPAVFFRREAFEGLGGLDPSLRAAFDFDLWLRTFLKYPERIGFIDKVQAFSRLHDGSITAKERRRVALEGVRVLKKNLGQANGNWLLSYFQELLEQCSAECRAVDLRPSFESVIAEAAEDLSEETIRELQAFVNTHPPLAWAADAVFPKVSVDLWAGFLARIDFRQTSPPATSLHVLCKHPFEEGEEIHLQVLTPIGNPRQVTIPAGQTVDLVLSCSSIPAGVRVVFVLLCKDGFQPGKIVATSMDFRYLTYQIVQCSIEK